MLLNGGNATWDIVSFIKNTFISTVKLQICVQSTTFLYLQLKTLDSGVGDNLQKRDLELLRISAAKLITNSFKLVYVVMNCGLIRLCHQNKHGQY